MKRKKQYHFYCRYFISGILFSLLFLQAGLSVFSQKQQTKDVQVTDCPRSQKQADIWYFGLNAGIDFRTGIAVPLTDENVMTSFKTSAVISDSIGDLLFFTNGKLTWDRTFNQLPFAPAMEGDLSVSQPCLIVPQPGDSNQYYIFTLDVIAFMPDNSYTTRGFKYSVVNMNNNGGLGDGTLKWNQSLLTPVSQKVSAVKHANGRDYWIVVHKWGSDEFYSYLLTNGGLATPVVSHAGSVHTGGYIDQTNAWGYMKLSPDGSKIALAISGLNKVELFDFSNSTGVVSNSQSYSFVTPGISPYGIEFSSDNHLLYTSLLQNGGDGPPTVPSRVYQFNLKTGLVNPTLIDTAVGVRLGGMQLATDGKIYVARTVNVRIYKDSLDVIYNPNRPGLECNYNSLNNTAGSRFSLSGRKSIYGLPNFIQSYFNFPSFTHDSVCRKDVTRFNIINKANIDSVSWDFGDGLYSNAMTPVHQYGTFGSYLVKLTENFNGKSYKDSVRITIHDLPHIDIGDTVMLFAGSTINLHAQPGYTEYTWSNGSTDSIINVTTSGNYWVKVKDQHCCYNSDSVYVMIFQYYVPNAFTPNGDGLNDRFRVFGLYKNVQFQMYIYNRWGQMVFETDNLDEGWDGTVNGSPCPAESYVWIAYINFLGQDIVTNGKIELKGSVILVR